jgi:hypothetical protein
MDRGTPRDVPKARARFHAVMRSRQAGPLRDMRASRNIRLSPQLDAASSAGEASQAIREGRPTQSRKSDRSCVPRTGQRPVHHGPPRFARTAMCTVGSHAWAGASRPAAFSETDHDRSPSTLPTPPARRYQGCASVRTVQPFGEKGTRCNSATAPATVSGERNRHMPLGPHAPGRPGSRDDPRVRRPAEVITLSGRGGRHGQRTLPSW